MTIASALIAAQGRVADAYTAISNKGGTLPATQNLANMPTAINSISGLIGETRTEQLDSTSGNTYTPSTGYNAITSITVTPKNYNRTVTAQTVPSTWAVPSGYSGHGNISVNAVTASIDANIQASNIKSGVSILGVSGDVVELNGETKTVSLTGFGQTFTPSSGKNAITSITVNPANLARTVNPSTTTQSIGVQSGFSGNGTITVNPVTASIDANIQAGNIKSGVTILGVTGTYGGGSSKYGATADTFLGNIDANGVLQLPSEQSDIVFTGVTDIVSYGLYYRFIRTNVKSVSFPDLVMISSSFACTDAFCNCPSLISVSLPNLTTINGSNVCNYMFDSCPALISVSLQSLTTISGTRACSRMFSYCPSLISLSLPSLTTIDSDNACNGMLQGSTSITDVYFNALTTSSFGSYINQFTNMMYGTGTNVTHTLHFPSNLTSTIAGLSGYPLFGGTSGYVVCAFDLPATS